MRSQAASHEAEIADLKRISATHAEELVVTCDQRHGEHIVSLQVHTDALQASLKTAEDNLGFFKELVAFKTCCNLRLMDETFHQKQAILAHEDDMQVLMSSISKLNDQLSASPVEVTRKRAPFQSPSAWAAENLTEKAILERIARGQYSSCSCGSSSGGSEGASTVCRWKGLCVGGSSKLGGIYSSGAFGSPTHSSCNIDVGSRSGGGQ